MPIVSPGYLQRREDLVLATIASRITDDPSAVHLWRGDFAEGRLPKVSMVKSTRQSTMHSLLVAKGFCALRFEKLEAVPVSLRRFVS